MTSDCCFGETKKPFYFGQLSSVSKEQKQNNKKVHTRRAGEENGNLRGAIAVTHLLDKELEIKRGGQMCETGVMRETMDR